MDKTLRDIVSELATDVKAITLEERVSFRFLANKFIYQLEYFLHQETRSREFIRKHNIWQSIDCLDLIDVSTNACGMIDECNTLKRSKEKLPKPIDTSYGLLIKVFTIDGLTQYNAVLPQSYKDYANREYSDNDIRTFYLQDDYIYIPNTSVESVKALVITKDFCKTSALNGKISKCYSPLDCVLAYPDYLISISKEAVLRQVAGVYEHIPTNRKETNVDISN